MTSSSLFTEMLFVSLINIVEETFEAIETGCLVIALEHQD